MRNHESTVHFDPEILLTSGALAAANREVFHPVGLALTLVYPPTGGPFLTITSGRDDPEGWIYEMDDYVREKLAAFEGVRDHCRPTREAALGYFVQPYEA